MMQRTGKLLGDAIYYSHLVLALVALASLPAFLIWPGLKGIIIAGLAVTLGSWVLLGGCALSDWERRLRRKYDPANDPGDELFVQRYFKRLFNIRFPLKYTKPFGYSYALCLVIAMVLR